MITQSQKELLRSLQTILKFQVTLIGSTSNTQFEIVLFSSSNALISPEAELGGPIALIEDGDEITIDANKDILELNISDDEMKKRPR